MNHLRPVRLLSGLLLGLLLIQATLPARAVQPGTRSPAVVIVAAPDLEPAPRARLDALAEGLRAVLPPETEVRLQAEAEPAPLILSVAPCAGDLCLTYAVTLPHAATLFAPDLEAAITANWPLTAPLTESTLPTLIDAAAGLFGYASGDCTPLPALDRAASALATAEGVQHGPILAFYRGACLHLQHDYPAALDVLVGPERAALWRADPPWPLRLLWDAYIANSHAQAFAFDRALAWDTRTIAMAAVLSPNEPLTARLLAEFYLLRGRHRLYLYEWDRVLADYNAALALPDAPARAYYDRGLLYYTQNVRQAAYDDLTHYLALESDPDSRLIPLARRYAAELEALLATPAAP